MPLPKRAEVKLDLISLLQRRGQLSTADVYVALAEHWSLSQSERAQMRSGGRLYENEIRWARQELAIAGLLERPHVSGRAVWRLKQSKQISADDYDIEQEGYAEGAVKRITVNSYERNKKARERCLRVHGYSCTICQFNFEQAFGEVGKGCMHVHHLIELSSIKENYTLNAVKDLAPVCPNCHYLIHRRHPAFTIEEAKALRKRISHSDAAE